MVVDPGLLVGFLALSAVLSAVPGPSVILATGRAITGGRSEAMRIVAGNVVGGLLLVLLAVLGLGAVVATSAKVFLVVKVLGALYLAYLGVSALMSLRGGGGGFAEREERERSPHLVRQGFLVGVSNPKSVVSLMAILPQFVDPSRGQVALQMAIIGTAGAIMQMVIETVWVLAADGLRTWFRRRPRRMAALRASGGIAMLGMAGRLALERRPAT